MFLHYLYKSFIKLSKKVDPSYMTCYKNREGMFMVAFEDMKLKKKEPKKISGFRKKILLLFFFFFLLPPHKTKPAA